MSKIDPSMEGMLDTFVFETSELLEKLDDILMRTEADELTPDDVGEIFRIMHTVKGSAAMMGLPNMSGLAHALEDLFSLIREDPNISYDKPALYELLYEGSDGLKNETEGLPDEDIPLSDFSDLTDRIHRFADVMKGIAPAPAAQTAADSPAPGGGSSAAGVYLPTDGEDVFAFLVKYQSTCAMPELRAMVLLNQLAAVGEVLSTVPADLDADDAGDRIAADGFIIKIQTDKPEDALSHLQAGLNVESAELVMRDETAVPADSPAPGGGSSAAGVYLPTDGEDVFAFLVKYQSACAMPELRAMVLLNQLAAVGEVLSTVPADLDADDAGDKISADGFIIKIQTDKPEAALSHLQAGLNVESAELILKGETAAADSPAPGGGSSAAGVYLPTDGEDVFAFLVKYQSTCAMPELRAMVLLNQLAAVGEVLSTVPADLDADDAGDKISADGFIIKIQTDKPEDALSHLQAGLNVESAELIMRAAPEKAAPPPPPAPVKAPKKTLPMTGSKIDPSMEGMLDMFVFETSELLEKLDDILMRTEADELTPDDVGEIFRVMHTVKGSAAMMGLQNMSGLAHALEDLFSLIREDPNISYDKPALYELLYEGSDGLKNETEGLPDPAVPLTDFSDLTDRIHRFADVMKGIAPALAAAPAAAAAADPAAEIYLPTDGEDIFAFRIKYQSACAMPELRAMVLLNQITAVGEVLKTIPPDLDADDAGDKIARNGFIIKVQTDKPEEVFAHLQAGLNVESADLVMKAAPPAKTAPAPAPAKKAESPKPAAAPADQAKQAAKSAPEAPKPAEAAKTAPAQQKKSPAHQEEKGGGGTSGAGAMISVKLEKLDRLMRLTQELVIAESGVLHNKYMTEQRKRDPELDKAARELKKLSDELQDNVMAVRMVPVSGAFSKMNRIVRDMNKTLGKGVKLVIEGDQTEVDKSVSDLLGDPLMHIIRNAVDHGIETPEDRKKSGKTEEPTVTLAAFYDSGDAVITITDNGYGMDAKKLLEKGREKGILTKPESEYTEQDCFDLIMAAGFSTNTEVTEYSGRGVGMDVVKKNLEKMGGKLLVNSKLGKGSVFTIRVPMSLSISDCMGVMIGGQEFALPVQMMVEAFRADKEQIIVSPDAGASAEFVQRRGENKLYRVIRLAKHFGIENAVEELDRGIMMIVKSGRGAAALFADALTEDMQLVVKPFSPYLAAMGLKERGFAGTSVLGDGSILIVMDPAEIMKGGD